MTYKLADQYAFPAEDEVSYQPGMTMRQYYAGQALVGLIAAYPDADCGLKGLAHDALLAADALIAELEKSGAQ